MALTLARPRPGSFRFNLTPGWSSGFVPWLVTALVAGLVVLPVVMLVLGSFSSARLPTDFSFAGLTLANYVQVYTDPLTYRVAGNTLVYVTGAITLGLSMATLLAWLAARSNMPGRWLALVGIPLSMIIPGMLESMVWVLLFSPRIGFVNRFATGVLGFESAPFDVYTMGGMIALESLRLVPTAFLMLLPLFLRFDPALEEAGAMSGARMPLVARRIVLPLLLPGLLSVALYQTVTVLSSFEVPGILGLPGQVYVFSTLVYTYTHAAASAGGNSFGSANALAMVYLLINVVGLWIYLRLTRNAASFAVITGKGYRPRAVDLGPWRWVAFGGLCAYLFMSVVLPILVLLWGSLTPILLQPTPQALSRLSLRNWTTMGADARLLETLGNTAMMVLATASIAVAISLVVSWIAVRTKFVGRGLLDQLAFVSHGVPGVILALALIWLWIRVDAIPLYGTVWIIILGMVTGFLAFGTRSMSAALMQVHTELEEAAYMSGAPPGTAIKHVIVPLLTPAMVGLWVWVAMHAVRFVTLPLMLQTGPENTVLAVYLWRLWEAGEINMVSTIGSAMIAVMLVVTLLVNRLGVGSRRAALTG